MLRRLLIGTTLFLSINVSLADVPQVEGLWQANYKKSNTHSADICVTTESNGDLKGIIKTPYARPDNLTPKDICIPCTGDKTPRPCEGIPVLWGMKSTGVNTWDSGNLCDAEKGLEYAGTMELSPDGQTINMVASVIGVKFLHRTEIWTKLKNTCN